MDKIYRPTGRNFDFAPGKKIYNLGCGKQNYPNTIGVDKVDNEILPNVKINHDLNIFPWPIADNSVDIVVAFHFLEHVDDLFKTIQEMHRISKNGSKIIIEVPHFRYSSAFKDPTHKHFFTCKTINYFCKENHSFTNLPFQINLTDLSIGWPTTNKFSLKYWVKKWLEKRKNQDLYDNIFYFFIQSNILVFELDVKK